LAEVGRQTNRFREVCVAIGHHANDARRLLIATPGTHHERIIDRDTPDFIHALGLQRIGVLHITGYMLGRTSRRVRAGQTKNGNRLALDQIRHIEGVWSECATFGLSLDEFGKLALGQVVSNFDAHSVFLFFQQKMGMKKVGKENRAQMLPSDAVSECLVCLA
jgi:hypothetical protein